MGLFCGISKPIEINCGSWLACDEGVSVSGGLADSPPSQASQLPHLVGISNQYGLCIWQPHITPNPINIGFSCRRFLNVTAVAKCVTPCPIMRQCATPVPRKPAFQTPQKIRLNARLAVPEGFANNRPAICSIYRFNVFCFCIKIRGCQCAGTAFSVLL